MCDFSKIKNNEIKNNVINNYEIYGAEKRNVEILHDKYLLPILELESNIEDWIIELQSLIIVFSFFLDNYIDEGAEKYKSICDKLLNDIFLIAQNNKFEKTFFDYFKEFMFYMISEKDVKNPNNFIKKYNLANVKYKAYIFLAIKKYLSNQTYSIYRDYLIFNLIADDFIDFKIDRDNMVLTTTTSLLGVCEEKGDLLEVNYNYMMELSKYLKTGCSKTIKQVVEEFVYYFQVKNIYDKVRKELLNNDWNY